MLLSYGDVTVNELWYVEEKPSSVFLRLYWIKSGHATYQQNHKTKVLRHNYLYAFPTNIPYFITQDPEQPLECTFLHIEINPYVLSELVELNMTREPILFHLFSIFSNISKSEPFNIYGAMQQDLSTCVITELKKKDMFSPIDARISDSLHYLFENIEKPISVNELSEISGYHPKYYNHLFLETIGSTPYQFLTQYRMKHALTLLQNGNSLTQTALKIGYTDKESFSRMFKKTYGILPSKIKKDFLSL